MAESVLLQGVLDVAGFGFIVGEVFFFSALLLWDLWIRFSSNHASFSLSRLFIFSRAIPRLILFLPLARFVTCLKSILTTSASWPWKPSACLDVSFSISASSSSNWREPSRNWEEFAFTLFLDGCAFSLFSFRRLTVALSGRRIVGVYAARFSVNALFPASRMLHSQPAFFFSYTPFECQP